MIAPTIRTYRNEDLRALVQLINDADRVDDAGYATTEETLDHRLAAPSLNATENVLVAEQDSRLVGYAILYRRPESTCDRVTAIGIVHPDWRRKGIGTALMKRAEEHVRALKGAKPLFLDMSIRERVLGAAELALSLGLRPVRYFFYMECDDLSQLPKPTFPAGITMRNYITGQDETAFVAAYNDAFSDHWGYVPHTMEKELHRVSAPHFRAKNNLLAIGRAGSIVGLCLVLFPQMETDMLEKNPPLIDDLAVRPAYRRRGIGRTLLLAGMHRIRDEGFSAAALAVDADNPNQALHLYESVGFVVISRSAAYRKELV